MSGIEVTEAELADVIHRFFKLRSTSSDHRQSRELAAEIMSKFTLTRKPPKPKHYEGKPRGGRLW